MIVHLRENLVITPILFPTLGLLTSVYFLSWAAQKLIIQLRNHKVEEFTSWMISFLVNNSGMGGGFMRLCNLLRYMGILSNLIHLASCVVGDIDQIHLQAQSDGTMSVDLRRAGEKNLLGF